ncbi:tRNA (cytidine(56)-2'-O)-methyltransferase [Geoglobus acetivorans]|uniref:tRNA (cytidine(56)-2'-O)-methyltransferase n=1 Tax=Geoglobus acetivorans TaxID=565033 RepID=A0ABZ3H3Q3_GEOAI|nr:tRNA (cytidine(56)-2'-O)-methyltransferase [Geoglobus acetivorans]
MEVYVLRLGHRPERDKRISTHVALTARAFGARGIYFDTSDTRLFESVRDVVDRWGGEFFIERAESWKSLIKNFEGVKVHLTMYGLPLPDKLHEIRNADKILVIVGAEKVPPEVYELSDYNIAIGNQPHSEVAALAIFLDRVLEGHVFNAEFEDARLRVIPSERGKKIIEND